MLSCKHKLLLSAISFVQIKLIWLRMIEFKVFNIKSMNAMK